MALAKTRCVFPTRPRLAKFDYLGRHRYFLTFCTNHRHRAFASPEDVAVVRAEIFDASTQCQFALLAYVFMPDHVHLLAEACSDACELKRFASLAKQRSGYRYAQTNARKLWQPSYYDHVLRPEESILWFVRYIFENPVRAGLTQRWQDYPFLGSQTMGNEEIIQALEEAGRGSP